MPKYIKSIFKVASLVKVRVYNFLLNTYKPVVKVEHISKKGRVDLLIQTTNLLTKYRAETFSSKEPETLNWIDDFGGDGPFYDIGANIGLYSLYHAKLYSDLVYAFEPSYLNLVNLSKNINLNNLTEKVIIISNPLFESNIISNFNMANIEDGGAHSTFSKNYNYQGNPLDIKFTYKTLGLSLEHLTQIQLFQPPSIIKIDVDGIEHLILKGANSILKNPNLKSILIEVHSEFQELQNLVKYLLEKNNFRHQKDMSSSENQIWCR